MPNFAKASVLTMFVMVAAFLLFLQTPFGSDVVKFFGITLLPFSLLLFIILTLRTKPKRTMKKFVRNLLVSCGFPYIFLLFAQPILGVLVIIIIGFLFVRGFGGSSYTGEYGNSSTVPDYTPGYGPKSVDDVARANYHQSLQDEARRDARRNND
jgi:hypothetical protein